MKVRSEDYLIRPGSKVRLQQRETSAKGFEGKKQAKKILVEKRKKLGELQNKLFAQKMHSVLIIFQAMDAAGKDSDIREVFSGIDPHGCHVTSFGRPSEEELAHDFLWRHQQHLPRKGHIGIFNRSYYEETLPVRVHPDLLALQNLPPEGLHNIWEHRFQDINAHEEHLRRNGTLVIKFFLNLSRDEQRMRFIERIVRKEKNYKFSSGDIKERALWNEYRKADEAMLEATSTEHAPWFIIPADKKWLSRAIIASIIAEKIKELKPIYPCMNRERRKELLLLKFDLEHEEAERKKKQRKARKKK